MFGWSLKRLKRLIVAVIGISLLVIGIAMIVLPGPAIINSMTKRSGMKVTPMVRTVTTRRNHGCRSC